MQRRLDGGWRRFAGACGVLAAMAATAGMALAGGMGGGGSGGGGCGGEGGIVNPPIGAVLRDPVEMPNLSTVPGVVEVKLEAKMAAIDVNGTTANLMTYNGAYPGPTIRVHSGDLLRIRESNSLPFTTAVNLLGHPRNVINLHTHGLHVSPEPPADDVMYTLRSGETYVHEYDLSMHPPGTLNFYHPHGHGSVAEQVWAGLAGALIVEDEDARLAGYETHVLVLKDIALSGANPAPHSTMSDYMHGKEGNVIMVSGQVNPRLYVKQGQVQRWRIVNASNARFYRLGVESHTLDLIGTDGGLLDRPYPLSELILSPGERADVLVKTSLRSGNYRLRSLPYARMGMMSSPTITLLTLTYNGTRSPAQSLPLTVNPDAVRLDPAAVPIAAERTLTLSMGMGCGYINGLTFDVEPLQIHSMLDTYEKWTVINASNMDHPFHQHVNAVQVLSVSGGDPGYASLYTTVPAMKDTVIVPKNGRAVLLVPIMDYAGCSMFHCHILEHEDIGMLALWHIMTMGGGMMLP